MDERRDGSGPRPSPDHAGHLTTTIQRPPNRRASDAGRSRLGDIRRRGWNWPHIPLPRLTTTWLFGLAALVVAGAIAAALFALPVRTWFDQDGELNALEHELTEMQAVNHDLQGEVDRLQTDDGIREAAREELGQIQAGDNRQTMLELPPLPGNLPDGWPYAQVGAILAVRAAIEASTTTVAAPTTTVAAPSTTVDAPTTTVAPRSTTTSPAPTTTAAP
jgi:septum formation initiator